MTQIEFPNLMDYAEDVAKANNGPMNVDQRDKQHNLLPSGNSLGGFLPSPRSKNVVQSFPVTAEDMPPQKN